MAITDNFNRADGGLGSNWTSLSSGGIGGTINIVSNQAQGTAGTTNNSVSSTVSQSATDSQFVQAKFVSAPTSAHKHLQVGLRAQNTVIGSMWPDGYAAGVEIATGFLDRYIFKYVSGAYTSITHFSTPAYTPGETVRFEAVGSTLRYYVNGVLAQTVSDASLIGSSYRYFYIQCHDGNQLDDFVAGDLPYFRSLAFQNYDFRTNTVIAPPAGLVDGDILILIFTMGNAGSAPPTPTLPTGFTELQAILMNDTSPYYGNPRIAWKLASSESGNYTISHANGRSAGALVCVSGGDTSTPISSKNTAATGNSVLSLSVTNPVNGSYLMHLGQIWDYVGVMTPPTGFTERYDATDTVLYVSELANVSAGPTGNQAQTGPSSNPWGFFQVLITPYLAYVPPVAGVGPWFRLASPRLVGVGATAVGPPDPNPNPSGQVFSDNFDSYADGSSLGSQTGWATVLGTVQISNPTGTAGEAKSIDPSTESDCKLTTGNYNENQYAEVTIGTVGSGFPESGVGVLLNVGTDNYAAQWFINPSGAQSIYIWTKSGGDLGHTPWGAPLIPVTGDVLRMERTGTGTATRLVVKVNGSVKQFDNVAGTLPIGTSIDPGIYISGGIPGITTQRRAGAGSYIGATSFRAGNL